MKLLPVVALMIVLLLSSQILTITCTPSSPHVAILFITSFGTSLSKAEVRVEYPNGRTIKCTLDDSGRIVLYNVPLGTLKITILKWRNINVGYKKVLFVASRFPVKKEVIVDIFGKINIRVVGLIGNPISCAIVKLDDGSFLGTTDSEGALSLELPEGRYTINILKENKKITTEIYIKKNRVENLTLRIDAIPVSSWFLVGTGELIAIIMFVTSLGIIFFLTISMLYYRKKNIIRK